MITITIPRNDHPRLWCGRFHFVVNADCNLEYLAGAKGGFVYAVGNAVDQDDFISLGSSALAERMLTVDAKVDDLEELTSMYLKGNLSPEWMDLGKSALETGAIQFATFRLYDSDDE